MLAVKLLDLLVGKLGLSGLWFQMSKPCSLWNMWCITNLSFVVVDAGVIRTSLILLINDEFSINKFIFQRIWLSFYVKNYISVAHEQHRLVGTQSIPIHSKVPGFQCKLLSIYFIHQFVNIVNIVSGQIQLWSSLISIICL